MDVTAFLGDVCAVSGLSGMEGPVAERIAKEFALYSEDVRTDPLGNALATMGDPDGPTVLLSAHMDEIGLIATGFDERGGVQFYQVGGVDPRILPGSEVVIHTQGGDLYGVIGAKPPHLADGAQKAPKLRDLAVDTGFGLATKDRVRIGDGISFKAPLVELGNGRIACKTFDDRACVAALLVAMEELKDVKLNCRAVFCASMAEEVGCRGAQVAGFGVDPDMAVALDVCFAPSPGVERHQVVPLDTVALMRGPYLHPAVCKRIADAAEALGVKTETEFSARSTGTDADTLQTARDGIPTALISVPLSYMHTTVELISVKTVREAGRLLAGFLRGVGRDWEEWLCL